MDFSPRVFHAVFAAMLCIICLLLGAKYEKYQLAYNCGAILFAVIVVFVLIALIADSYVRVIDAQTDFAIAYGKLDDEGRAAMGFMFPNMRHVMHRGKIRQMFEDTNVPIELFKEFMLDSRKDYVSAERNWQTPERPAWAWREIYTWLTSHNLVAPDSSAGSHSHRWIGHAYSHLCAYWLEGRKVQNMAEQEIEAV